MTDAERFQKAMRAILSVSSERADEINRQFPMNQTEQADERRERAAERQDRPRRLGKLRRD